MKQASDLPIATHSRYAQAHPVTLGRTAEVVADRVRLTLAMVCVSVIWGYLFFLALQSAGVTNG